MLFEIQLSDVFEFASEGIATMGLTGWLTSTALAAFGGYAAKTAIVKRYKKNDLLDQKFLVGRTEFGFANGGGVVDLGGSHTSPQNIKQELEAYKSGCFRDFFLSDGAEIDINTLKKIAKHIDKEFAAGRDPSPNVFSHLPRFVEDVDIGRFRAAFVNFFAPYEHARLGVPMRNPDVMRLNAKNKNPNIKYIEEKKPGTHYVLVYEPEAERRRFRFLAIEPDDMRYIGKNHFLDIVSKVKTGGGQIPTEFSDIGWYRVIDSGNIFIDNSDKASGKIRAHESENTQALRLQTHSRVVHELIRDPDLRAFHNVDFPTGRVIRQHVDRSTRKVDERVLHPGAINRLLVDVPGMSVSI